MTGAIITVKELAIRPIIAHDEIQIAIAVKVCESCGVRSVRQVTHGVALYETATSVVYEYDVQQGPMASFGQDDIKITITIEIPKARVSACFGCCFQVDSISEPEFADFFRPWP
jgi:hypothetical protein